MRTSLLILIALISFSRITAQQKEQPVNFPSPNAAAFSVFGNIPVNQFSGTPNISIPIYDLKEGDISLPISLQYHPSGAQVNNHPGWTGLGMSLLCGGAISRNQKGYPDEQKSSSGSAIGFYYNYQRLNSSGWNTVAGMKQLASDMTFGTPTNIDPIADEFSFNFLGYSGTFMLDENGQWKVSGTDDIKVIVDPLEGIIPLSQIRNDIRTKIPYEAYYFSSYFFNKFKLITPDGTVYEFGGINATEYSVPYRNQSKGYVTPTTWFLTKIKSISGKEINLTYEAGSLIATMAHQYSVSKYNRPGGGWFSLNPSCSATSVNLSRMPASGYLIFPVYLSQVTSSFQTITFARFPSTELRYINYDLDDDFLNQEDQFVYFSNQQNEIKWFQLDKISIADNQGTLFKTFNFGYSKSLTTRLKLLSLTEEDKNHLQSSKYKFSYNSKSVPNYCIDQVDHWGYYNGYNLSTFVPNTVDEWISLYPSTRAPDQDGQFIKADLLEKVIYPTGGYTVYEYEPHTYAKVVDLNRTALIGFSNNQPGGGARIKRISSYEFDDTPLLTKEYYYVKNYNGQTDLSGLSSSGILGGLSQYYWPGFVGKDLDDNSFTYDLFSSNSLLPSYINSNGSHIGYSEVVEKISGNGYSKTFFSNFDTDVFGANHLDESPITYLDATRSVYSPYTSKSLERGFPQLTEIYNEANQKIQSSKVFYEPTNFEYWRSLDLEHLDICSNVTASAQIWFGTAFKNYRYSFLKTKEEATTYETNLSNSVTTTTFYHYNDNKLLDRITQSNSLGAEKKKEIIYPTTIAIGADPSDKETKAIEVMAGDAHMINYPVETTDYMNGTVINSVVNKYKYESNKVVPSKNYRTQLESAVAPNNYQKVHMLGTGVNSMVTLDPTCNLLTDTYNYDINCNIKDYTSENGIVTTYLWSYKKLFPVARIVNASYQDIVDVLGQSVIDNLSSANPTNTELEQTLQPLRTNPGLKKAMVTTYTYAPLQGLTSITDENGMKTYFEYDTFGRLLYAKDNNKNVMKKYEYNYQAK